MLYAAINKAIRGEWIDMFRMFPQPSPDVITRFMRVIRNYLWIARTGRAMTFVLIIMFCAFPAHAACTLPAGDTGDIIYNEDEKVFQGCLSTGWVALQSPGYKAQAVRFRSTDYLTTTNVSNLSPEGTQVTLSFWVQRIGGIGNNLAYVFDFGHIGKATYYAPNNFGIIFEDPSSADDIVRCALTPAVTDNEWYHYLVSFDLSDVNKRHFYINDAPATANCVFYNTAETMKFNRTEILRVGIRGNITSSVNGNVADFWFDPNTYMDLTIEANRRKFIDARGYPVHLGDNGENVTGVSPEIFLSGKKSDWLTNKGSFPVTFTEVGTVQDSGLVERAGTGELPCNTIGQVCADGTVYAGESPDGTVPMYTTENDVGRFTFNNGNTDGLLNSLVSGNSGVINTTILHNADADSNATGFQNHMAAQACVNLEAHGHSDWYLPSDQELLELCNNKASIPNLDTTGGYGFSTYFSSNDGDGNNANIRFFSSCGSGFVGTKSQLHSVRCVRKSAKPTSCFSPPGIEGDIVYNSDEGVFQGCVGSHWEALHEPAYVPNAVNINANTGSESYISLATSLNNIDDSQKLTLSFWAKYPDAATGHLISLSDGFNQRLQIFYNSNNTYTVGTYDSAGTFVAGWNTNSCEASLDGVWRHIIFSFDTTGKTAYSYCNDQLMGSYTTSSNLFVDFAGGSKSFFLGRRPGGSPNAAESQIADFWMETDYYLDLSVEANRRKFIDANGYPVYLGENGERVTGQAPDIFLSGDTANWHTNKGTGGGFTENGALTDGNPVTKAGTAIPTSGLIGHWTFDTLSSPLSGTTVPDSSGNGNNGTLGSQMFESPGVIGQSLSCFNIDNCIISIPNFINSVTDDFTFTGWINPNFSATFMRIFRSGVSDFTVNSNGTFNFGGSSNVIPNIEGNWHMFALMFDASTNTAQIYVNGSLEGTMGPIANDDGDVFDNFGWSNGGMRGRFDDFRLYSRLLSAAEITALYEQGAPCTSPTAFNGDIIFNTAEDTFQGCARTGWKAMGGVGP